MLTISQCSGVIAIPSCWASSSAISGVHWASCKRYPSSSTWTFGRLEEPLPPDPVDPLPQALPRMPPFIVGVEDPLHDVGDLGPPRRVVREAEGGQLHVCRLWGGGRGRFRPP